MKLRRIKSKALILSVRFYLFYFFASPRQPRRRWIRRSSRGPRLFRGYKRVTETPESYENFDETVKLYLEIFKLR
jgi:hypothetical protein